MKHNFLTISLNITGLLQKDKYVRKYMFFILLCLLTSLSTFCFLIYQHNGLGLAYNDARSHLDIGRRVVEGLKPGLAQLGSVWLPLPHLLMVLTIWNDFMWHTGLAGALQSMISFVATSLLVYYFLKHLGVGMIGRLVGVFVFAFNLNVLYLQSTAMTELLLIATSMAGIYALLLWQTKNSLVYLVQSAFFVMLSTLNRYDGWFLFAYVTAIVVLLMWKSYGRKAAEGYFFLFVTLGGFGIVLWFLWNKLIFNDALYFIFGPYSAHAQQQQLQQAGVLQTKGNLLLAIKVYYYALAYNQYTLPIILGFAGAIALAFDKSVSFAKKLVCSALFAPFIFNILALYLGFSVLFVQGISGNTWFNVRYGILMAPSIAVFIGYLIHRFKNIRVLLITLLIFVNVFAFFNQDAVTIDDARVGSSQVNVTEVASWLQNHAKDKPGFILISAASHDAIIFSSGLPMSRFIHEGTGAYWTSATTSPDRWARWIIMRTNDLNDQTFKLIHTTPGFKKYHLVGHYPFADIYELDTRYLGQLHTTPILSKQK